MCGRLSRAVGVTTNVMDKIWALRDGLQSAIHLGINAIEVKLHAKVVLDMILNNQNSNRNFFGFLSDSRELLTAFLSIELNMFQS